MGTSFCRRNSDGPEHDFYATPPERLKSCLSSNASRKLYGNPVAAVGIFLRSLSSMGIAFSLPT